MAKTPGYWDGTKYAPLIPKGNKDTFGRVKVSDTITDTDESNSCAVSPKAVNDAINNINQKGYLTATDFSSGDNNGTIKVGSTNIEVKGLGSAAYEETTDFLASDSIATGDNNGTIKVGSTNIEVKGLGSAAYKETTDFASSSTAATLDTLLGSGSLGSSTKPIYLSNKEFKECNDYPVYKADGTNILLDNNTNTFSLSSDITNDLHKKNSASVAVQTDAINIGGDSIPQVVTNLEYTDYGHVSKITKSNVVLNAPGNNSLGGVKTGEYIKIDPNGIISHNEDTSFLLYGTKFKDIQEGSVKNLLAIKNLSDDSDPRRIASVYNRKGELITTLGHGQYPLRLSSNSTITTNQVFETTSAFLTQKEHVASIDKEGNKTYLAVNLGSLGSEAPINQKTEKLIPLEKTRFTGLDVFTPYWDYGTTSSQEAASRGVHIGRSGTLLISGRIFFGQLDTGSKNIIGKIYKRSANATSGKGTELYGGRVKVSLPTAETSGFVVIPPFSIEVTQGDYISLAAEITGTTKGRVGGETVNNNSFTSLFLQFLD